MNYTSERNFSFPFSPKEIVFPSVLLLVFFFAGFILNLLIIRVILQNNDLKRKYIVILSLCISDLLSAVVSPLFWYRRTIGFNVWKLPKILCKIFWFFDFTTSCSTCLHITLFAFLRYLAVQNRKANVIKFQHLKFTVGILWAISALGAGLPFSIFYNVAPRSERPKKWDKWPSCTLSHNWVTENLWYERVALPIFFALPTTAIVILSAMTWILVKSTDSQAKKKLPFQRKKNQGKRVVLQLSLIVASFFLGYLPILGYEILATTPGALATNRIDYWFGFVAYLFLRFSECLNPIFYILGSKQIRAKTSSYLTQLMSILKCACVIRVKTVN